jgi:hypothetical protein
MEYKEGVDSTFTHFGKEYYVDDLIALTKGEPVKSLEVSRLDWIFDYTTPDPERVKNASLHYPIIVTKDFVDGKERYIVVDGTHRLARAIQLHKQYVKCYILDKRDVKSLPEVKR